MRQIALPFLSGRLPTSSLMIRSDHINYAGVQSICNRRLRNLDVKHCVYIKANGTTKTPYRCRRSLIPRQIHVIPLQLYAKTTFLLIHCTWSAQFRRNASGHYYTSETLTDRRRLTCGQRWSLLTDLSNYVGICRLIFSDDVFS